VPESCLRLNHQNQPLPGLLRISRHASAACCDSFGLCCDCASSQSRVSASRSHAMLCSGSPIHVSRLAPIQLPVCRWWSSCCGGCSARKSETVVVTISEVDSSSVYSELRKSWPSRG